MASERLGVKLDDNLDDLKQKAAENDVKVSSDEEFKTGGLTVNRLYSNPGVDPYDGVEWENRSATIAGDGGDVVFEQKDVEILRVFLFLLGDAFLLPLRRRLYCRHLNRLRSLIHHLHHYSRYWLL